MKDLYLPKTNRDKFAERKKNFVVFFAFYAKNKHHHR
jgi:hypothetical protein